MVLNVRLTPADGGYYTRAESTITINHAVCVATTLKCSHDTRMSITLFFTLANVLAKVSLSTPYLIVALT
jgi:hypothetical protein